MTSPASDTLSLAEALEDFRSRHPRDPNRQRAIQRYCCQELAARGIAGALPEVEMPAAYRNKIWDVGLIVAGKPRLAISCKSIIANHGGTAPNRIDDMLGEAVSLHRAHPDAVLGYMFMMSCRDESKRTEAQTEKLGGLTAERQAKLRADADQWFDTLVDSVGRAGGRQGPDDLPEQFEAVSCSQVDFDSNPYKVGVHQSALSPEQFFDLLAEIYFDRFSG